ncbi:MAG: N-acetyl-gamma-glutamyl-phosphate reductase [Pseudomonadales bacterium]|nr:N-acetyl-gamma-glutamyl-phosphate reductase [Pseudomonadales bacterium]
MTLVFIDGQAGTTGLQIAERLQHRNDIELLTLTDDERKNPARRKACLIDSDVAILCLPDDAARESVALAEGNTRILDASTAYRVDPDWAYGLPELADNQRGVISDAQFVSNPGCYPQGFILIVRPLIEAGLLASTLPLRCHAVSGYSGGGRQMVEKRQAFSAAEIDRFNSQLYALTLEHKHVPEMHAYSRAEVRPFFSPSVAHYYKGMLVQIPVFANELSGTVSEVHNVLSERYAHEQFVDVLPLGTDVAPDGYLDPTACNDTNRLEIMVLGNEEQILLVARYDNLGKGASGAAIQNMNLMLGINEATGL